MGVWDYITSSPSPELTNLKFLPQIMRKLDENFSMWMWSKKFNYRLSCLYTKWWCFRKLFDIQKYWTTYCTEIQTWYELYISLAPILLYFLIWKLGVFYSNIHVATKYFSLLKKENSDSKSLLTHKLQNALRKLSSLILQWYSLEALSCGNWGSSPMHALVMFLSITSYCIFFYVWKAL